MAEADPTQTGTGDRDNLSSTIVGNGTASNEHEQKETSIKQSATEKNTTEEDPSPSENIENAYTDVSLNQANEVDGENVITALQEMSGETSPVIGKSTDQTTDKPSKSDHGDGLPPEQQQDPDNPYSELRKGLSGKKKVLEPSAFTLNQSSGTSDEPSGTAEEPSGTAEEPSGTAEEPSGTAKEPSGTAKEPSGTAEEPSGTAEEPSGTAKKPSGTAEEPSGTAKERNAAVILGILLAFCSVLVMWFNSTPLPPEQAKISQVDIFLRERKRVEAEFPGQRPELWRRSMIHLERHLQMAQPTEPVSLILTAGRRAEKTLHCLAHRLASAYSSAHNASVLHIDGASKATQDSDQVKLDIDGQLRGAFEGDKPVAVIHRFEELPPGSTLIFYRYCDHENAAYKKALLIFTVLLEREEEVSSHLSLSMVEEMVDDHLQAKFLSSDHPAAYDEMDMDKFSGLWSRISHLVLPVAAVEGMEKQGCGGTVGA